MLFHRKFMTKESVKKKIGKSTRNNTEKDSVYNVQNSVPLNY